jgi:hypothetical protein
VTGELSRCYHVGVRSLAMFQLRILPLVVLMPSMLLVPLGLRAQDAPAAPDQSANGAPPSPDAAEEGSMPYRKWLRLVQTELVEEKFDDLDRMADEYRAEKRRGQGGGWSLHTLYAALDAPQQSDKDTEDHLGHLERWIAARPESITARVALATSLRRWAWVARGHGYAKTVTPDGWRLFNERMAKAQSVLEVAEKLRATDPQWSVEMMNVGLAQSWDANRMRDAFERGVQAEPDYYYLYLVYADYLLPKWDGKPGDASAFAKTSADNVGGEAGDELYFHIATILIRRGDGSFPVHEMDWQRIQRGYETLTAQYGSSRQTKNQIAYMAWKFGDAAFARKQFLSIGDNWAISVWGTRELFDRARDWSQGSDSLAAPSSEPSGR